MLLINFISFLYNFHFRAPPSPILPPGVGALYSPSASFQSLLANISAAQHSVHQQAISSAGKPPAPSMEYLSPHSSGSPPLSPPMPMATNLSSTAGGIGGNSNSNSTASTSPPPPNAPDDRRSSSIAALRLKAREHMLRQNGHSDIIS